MRTINISLPDALCQYVDEQMQAGDYTSPSEYFRDLIRADQKRQAKEALQESLLTALAEGHAEEAAPEWWETLQEEVHNHAGKSETES